MLRIDFRGEIERRDMMTADIRRPLEREQVLVIVVVVSLASS